MAMDGHGCIYELDMAWSTTTFAFFLVINPLACPMAREAMCVLNIFSLLSTNICPAAKAELVVSLMERYMSLESISNLLTDLYYSIQNFIGGLPFRFD